MQHARTARITPEEDVDADSSEKYEHPSLKVNLGLTSGLE